MEKNKSYRNSEEQLSTGLSMFVLQLKWIFLLTLAHTTGYYIMFLTVMRY